MFTGHMKLILVLRHYENCIVLHFEMKPAGLIHPALKKLNKKTGVSVNISTRLKIKPALIRDIL